MKIRHTYLLLLALLPLGTMAQFELNTGQIIKTVEFFNPAYNGVKDFTSASMLYRGPFSSSNSLTSPNYVNDLAYSTKAINVHHPFLLSKTGIGINVIQEQLGHRSNTIADVAFDASIRTSQTGFLCLGIAAGINLWQYNLNNALHNYGTLAFSDYNSSFPHFNVGLHFVKKGLQLGGSYHLVMPGNSETTNWYFGETSIYNSFYVNGSIQFPLSEYVYVKPAVVAKFRTADKKDFLIESGVHFLILDRVWIGASYRESWVFDAVSIVSDFKVNEYLHIGYAYEWSLADVGFLSSSIHEFRIQLGLPRKTKDQYLSQNSH